MAAVLHGVALVAASLPGDGLGGSRFVYGQPWLQQLCLGTALVSASLLRYSFSCSRFAWR